MKAAVYFKYGPPEVVQVKEYPMPVCGDNDLLIKVGYSTVNRTDSGFRSAEYFISRFWSGLLRPKFKVLGCEFAGTVESVGKEVKNFRIGDKVFGFDDKSFGGHAEYKVISENKAVALIPEGFDLEMAAALTEGSHYALVDLRAANVKPGQQIMIYGATGAIGSAAVQLVKSIGASVTAVCNTKNVDLVRSLGADTVVDYLTEDFTKTELRYDLILDAVGKSSFAKCKPLLKENGIYISTELGKNGQNVFFALGASFRKKGKRVLFPIPSINKEDVEYIKELAQKGLFRPIIDRSFDLDQIIDAYKYVETGQKTGNVILKIA
jgi:NADPH:quinone reductase-like Zn-dependent oxidoreductase